MSECPYEKRIFCPAFHIGIQNLDVCPDCGAETDPDRYEECEKEPQK